MTTAEAAAEARRLVIHEGYSYQEAAQATGIPLSTLQKRGAAEGWRGLRDSNASYNATVAKLKTDMLAVAIESKDPQKLYAWLAVEKVYPASRYQPANTDGKVKLAIGAEVVTSLVDFIGKADRRALTILAPHLEAFAAHWEKACAA